MAKSNLSASEINMLQSLGHDVRPTQPGVTAAEIAAAQGEDMTRKSFARIPNNDTPPSVAMLGVEEQKGTPNPSGL